MIFRSNPLVLPAFMLTAILLTGCYSRWTGNYAEIPELTVENISIVETTELSEDDHQKQLEMLQELAAEGEPGYTINGGDKIAVVVYNHPDLST